MSPHKANFSHSVLDATAIKIQPAMIGGVPILITSTTTRGGRKLAIKKIPNSDRQIVEDLGGKTRSFILNGTVSTRLPEFTDFPEYHNNRDNLLHALEYGGPLTLVHPWYGKIENIHVADYEIEETTESVGDSRIKLTLEIGNSEGLPFESERVIDLVLGKRDEVVRIATTKITGIKFEFREFDESVAVFIGPDLPPININVPGGHAEWLSILDDVGDTLTKASTIATAQLNKIDAHTQKLSNFTGSITDLALVPQQLMDSINGLFTSLNGVFGSFDAGLFAMKSIFSFQDGYPFVVPFTKSLFARKKNRQLMRSAMQSSAIANAYVNAAQIDFGSVDELEAVADTLEVQYQKMIADENLLDDETRDALTSMRRTTQEFFDAKKLTTRQIITINTPPTTTRVLAYQYYGSSDLGLEIMTLNNLQDPYLISGDVSILTE